jgi:hypothetical protein
LGERAFLGSSAAKMAKRLSRTLSARMQKMGSGTSGESKFADVPVDIAAGQRKIKATPQFQTVNLLDVSREPSAPVAVWNATRHPLWHLWWQHLAALTLLGWGIEFEHEPPPSAVHLSHCVLDGFLAF